MGIRGQLHTPATFHLGKNVGTHWIGGRVGPKESPNVLEKKKVLPLPGFEIRTVQYTVYLFTYLREAAEYIIVKLLL
jgi:hypothetical protein